MINIRLADFKNKKVLIMGLGLHGGGAGAASFFHCLSAKQGGAAAERLQTIEPRINFANITAREAEYIN